MAVEHLLPERIYGLEAAEGRRLVRPGEPVRFRFRTHNSGPVPTPRARLGFSLPPGWSATDPLELDVPPIAPGHEHVAFLSACADRADEETAVSPVQAVLYVDELALGSNVVRIRVFGRPLLNGPASAIRIEPLGEGVLRVATVLVNEGDAAARQVRVSVPAPPGFETDPRTTTATLPYLGVGQSLEFAYEMRPVSPTAPVVRIDDGFVRYDRGQAVLATVQPCELHPELSAPVVRVVRRANRLDLDVGVANLGWVPARDVVCSVTLPPGWHTLRNALLVDGAPAMHPRDVPSESGVVVTLPLIPARGSVALRVVASSARPGPDGLVGIRYGQHHVDVPIPAPTQRALRIEAHAPRPYTEPGSRCPLAVELHNVGDTTEWVTLALDGTTWGSAELRPGAIAHFAPEAAVPPDAADGDTLRFSVTAAASDGAVLAAAAAELRVLHRPWVAIDEIEPSADGPRITLRSVGASIVRDLPLDHDERFAIEPLAPGESRTVLLDSQLARRSRFIADDVGWDAQPDVLPVVATISAPPTIRSGERLDVRLRVRGEGLVGTLRVHPRPPAGAAYVAGSTTVGGHAVVDGAEGPPLLVGDGLTLHDIPAGTEVVVTWALLPTLPGELTLELEVTADGTSIAPAALVIAVADAPPFGARPRSLPFHVEATTVAEPLQIEPPPAEPGAPIAILALDDGRRTAIVRVLRGSRGPGIIAHLPALGLLFPPQLGVDDAALGESLAAAGAAVRGVYERLFVKLRVPGYTIETDDLEDASMRSALLGLLERAAAAPPATAPPAAPGELRVALDGATLEAARLALLEAPLGGPATLAALATFLPRGGAGDDARALGAYAEVLCSELAQAAAGPPDGFAAGLMTQSSELLETTRDAAIEVLEQRSQPVTG